MARVKRGVSHAKRRKRLLKAAKGYKWGRKSKIKLAKTAVTKAGAHAYRDRRKKKSVMRRLWQTQLNGAVRVYGLSYSKFIEAMKKKKIELDRKVLSQLAKDYPDTFKAFMRELLKKK